MLAYPQDLSIHSFQVFVSFRPICRHLARKLKFLVLHLHGRIRIALCFANQVDLEESATTTCLQTTSILNPSTPRFSHQCIRSHTACRTSGSRQLRSGCSGRYRCIPRSTRPIASRPTDVSSTFVHPEKLDVPAETCHPIVGWLPDSVAVELKLAARYTSLAKVCLRGARRPKPVVRRCVSVGAGLFPSSMDLPDHSCGSPRDP